MRTILLTLLCVLAFNMQAVETGKYTVDKYVIDQQVIERFDGSQLEGKTISKYIIAYKDCGDIVEKTHVVFTDTPNISSIDVKDGSVYEGLIIVDGKEVDRYEFKDIVKTCDITAVNIYKPGSKVANSYGEKGQKGVLVITTEANKTPENIYFINGERVSKSIVDGLSPNKIANMSINKEDGKSVIYIVTK